jgi:hypothetical protein
VDTPYIPITKVRGFTAFWIKGHPLRLFGKFPQLEPAHLYEHRKTTLSLPADHAVMIVLTTNQSRSSQEIFTITPSLTLNSSFLLPSAVR